MGRRSAALRYRGNNVLLIVFNKKLLFILQRESVGSGWEERAASVAGGRAESSASVAGGRNWRPESPASGRWSSASFGLPRSSAPLHTSRRRQAMPINTQTRRILEQLEQMNTPVKVCSCFGLVWLVCSQEFLKAMFAIVMSASEVHLPSDTPIF